MTTYIRYICKLIHKLIYIYCRCTLHGSIDISADKDNSQYAYNATQNTDIKGDEKEDEVEHKIPGNTVYYKVLLKQQNEKSKCLSWSLRVTGLQMGRCGHACSCHSYQFFHRFNTSYLLLRILLGGGASDPTTPLKPLLTLPLVQLWPKLITAACELTGEQRLKVLGLLLQLLHLNSTSNISASNSSGATPITGPRLDLILLKPLWLLYTTMTKNEGRKMFI